jgi:hypothetical protein
MSGIVGGSADLGRRAGTGREAQCEERPAAGSVGRRGVAAVLGGNPGHDGQPEAGALPDPGPVGLPEPVEHMGQRFVVEATCGTRSTPSTRP